MQEPTHAPGWRGRPARYEDLRADMDDAAIELERWLSVGCIIGGAISLLAAALAFGGDLIAGHL